MSGKIIKQVCIMDYTLLLMIISFLWICKNVITFFLSVSRPNFDKLPPGPPRWPLIGNLLDLGIKEKPHVSFAKLSKIYGPIMTIKVCSLTTTVITSPELTRQVLQVHDREFSSRYVPDAHHALDHYKFSVLTLPADSHWRSLRKLCNKFVFSSKRLEFSQALRREKVQGLLDYVDQCCRNGLEVDIGRIGFITALNLMFSTFCSTDVGGYECGKSQEYKDLIWSINKESMRPNVADYVPLLRRLDPQGVRRRTSILFRKILGIFEGIIEERLKSKEVASQTSTSMDSCDVLDALLNLPQDEIGFKLTENDITHLFMDLLAGGADSTTITLEWAMTELQRNPAAMEKAKLELLQYCGTDKILQESDISNLPYLQAIVKETLRMHPVTPILNHKSTTDVEVHGFIIPKDSVVFINIWAMSKDAMIWSDPEAFKPERFREGSSVDFTGQHFQYVPFGAGRRMCPGMSLANRVVPLMLGSLIHAFDWKLPDGMKPEDIDMDDKVGITLQKAIPLRLIPLKKTSG